MGGGHGSNIRRVIVAAREHGKSHQAPPKSLKVIGDRCPLQTPQAAQKRTFPNRRFVRSRHCRPTTSTTKGDHLAGRSPLAGPPPISVRTLRLRLRPYG